MAKERQKDPKESPPTTLNEIHEAINSLSDSQSLRLRKFAKKMAWKLGGKAGITWQEVVDEALIKILSGERQWKKDNVDFVGLLCGIMKSMLSHSLEKRKADKYQEPFLESDLIKEDIDGQIVNPLNEIKSLEPDPERILIAKNQIEQIKRHFEKDTEICLIIQGFKEGMTGPEIQVCLDLSEHNFNAAMKRMRRDKKILEFYRGNTNE